MDNEKQNELISQLENELTGDPELDGNILMEWAEKYRTMQDAEILNRYISRKMVDLLIEEDGDLPEQIISDILADANDIYDEACSLIGQEKYEEAVEKLAPLVQLADEFSLPPDTIWMDFNSYLDSLLYMDYFDDFINDREIGRHPLHPGRILYTYGSLLIELGRPEDALEPLQMLVSYDPVCPKYLAELCEACKRTGNIQDAASNALWALSCASTNQELARAYRDLAYCLGETGAYEDALMINMLSLQYHKTRHAEAEIAWIQKKAGLSPAAYDEETIRKRCEELGIPIGISETVKLNQAFLDSLQ